MVQTTVSRIVSHERREVGVARLRHDAGQSGLAPVRLVDWPFGAVVTEELTSPRSNRNNVVSFPTRLSSTMRERLPPRRARCRAGR